MSTNRVLGGVEASMAVARVAFLRVVRGRALWVVLGLSMLPILSAVLLKLFDVKDAWVGTVELWAFLLVILPPVLLSSAIGEEIEERTGAYLWSRPLPRWSIVVGKLVALVPALWVVLALALMVPFFIFSADSAEDGAARVIAALIIGTIGTSATAAGIATLAPRFGTIIAIAYLAVIDRNLAWFDASISKFSIAYNTLCLAGVHTGQSVVEALIWLFGLSALWMAIAVWRIRRME